MEKMKGIPSTDNVKNTNYNYHHTKCILYKPHNSTWWVYGSRATEVMSFMIHVQLGT